MCTVTVIPGSRGYRLGMNRDEMLTRRKGHPPEPGIVRGRWYIAPREPGGGTWIGLNDQGVGLALINWYSVTRRAASQPVSRGEIIPASAHAEDAKAVAMVLAESPLQRINPFRLIGVFPRAGGIVEWRWDLKTLTSHKHAWRAQQWISSGFDEPGAQRVRGATFAAARRQKSFGSGAWLRRLHRSHAPEAGPYSTCMHREDAATVSYTEIVVGGRAGVMRYHAGAPCCEAAESICTLAMA